MPQRYWLTILASHLMCHRGAEHRNLDEQSSSWLALLNRLAEQVADIESKLPTYLSTHPNEDLLNASYRIVCNMSYELHCLLTFLVGQYHPLPVPANYVQQAPYLHPARKFAKHASAVSEHECGDDPYDRSIMENECVRATGAITSTVPCDHLPNTSVNRGDDSADGSLIVVYHLFCLVTLFAVICSLTCYFHLFDNEVRSTSALYARRYRRIENPVHSISLSGWTHIYRDVLVQGTSMVWNNEVYLVL
ncbi:hypothetical protein BV25DRAFT_1094136 [Artomyces pyxidatus]|uniref:Uncharacterized protein n=1 Tax=Artomyces pyxidatus TaxID=48021 RepID=A0ACB8TG05_9AGAM|nr:hypothetical protein BV25DRAFT_1094136 [Artomyces pyxidatus]